MSYVLIDDNFPIHPKVIRAGAEAVFLHLHALAYSKRFNTDGFVPADMLPTFPGVTKHAKRAAKLVEVGLWDRTETGWKIHDYHDYNDAAAVVSERKKAQRERQKAHRQRAKALTKQPATKTTPEQFREVTKPVTRDSHTLSRAEDQARNASYTDTDTDTDTSIEKPRFKPVAKPPPAKSGSERARDFVRDATGRAFLGDPREWPEVVTVVAEYSKRFSPLELREYHRDIRTRALVAALVDYTPDQLRLAIREAARSKFSEERYKQLDCILHDPAKIDSWLQEAPQKLLKAATGGNLDRATKAQQRPAEAEQTASSGRVPMPAEMVDRILGAKPAAEVTP